MPCIFCSIIENQTSSSIVFRDEYTVAFLDKHPANAGHTLVVPCEHLGSIFELSESHWEHVAKTVKHVSEAIRQAMNTDSVIIKMNNGIHAGQDVPHAHVHVVPRYANDGVLPYMLQGKYEIGEAERVGALLRSFLHGDGKQDV